MATVHNKFMQYLATFMVVVGLLAGGFALTSVASTPAGATTTITASWTVLGGDPLFPGGIHTRQAYVKDMASARAASAMAYAGLSSSEASVFVTTAREGKFSSCTLTYGEFFTKMSYGNPIWVDQNVKFEDPRFKNGAPAYCQQTTVASSSTVNKAAEKLVKTVTNQDGSKTLYYNQTWTTTTTSTVLYTLIPQKCANFAVKYTKKHTVTKKVVHHLTSNVPAPTPPPTTVPPTPTPPPTTVPPAPVSITCGAGQTAVYNSVGVVISCITVTVPVTVVVTPPPPVVVVIPPPVTVVATPPPTISITSMTTLNQIPEGKNSGPFNITVNASASGGSLTVDPGIGSVSTCNSSTEQSSVTFSNLSSGNSNECIILYAPSDASQPSSMTATLTANLGIASDVKTQSFTITYPTRPS